MANDGSKALDRRRFLQFGAGAIAFGVALASGASVSFAGDGAGTGDDDGSVTGGSDESYYGFMWTWHDNGGFVNGSFDPEFGWDEDSISGFWGGPMQERWVSVGNRVLGTNRSSFSWYGGNDAWNHYHRAAQEAIDEAKARAGSEHARIVAAGWSIGYYSRGGKVGTMYINQWSTDRYARNLLSRDARSTVTGASDSGGDGAVKYYVGNSISDLGAGLAHDQAGWLSPATAPNGREYDTWMDYLWATHSADINSSKRDYVFIVLAVADTEPMSHGYLTVAKGVSA